MTNTKTPATETDNNEDQKQQSDARIILGPLVKYAAMGLVLVSIIISTAVMLDRQFNDIDREVAELEAQLAQANKNMANEPDTDTTVELKAESVPAVETVAAQPQPVITEVVEVTEVEKPAASAVEKTVDKAPAVTQLANKPVEKKTSTTETVVADVTVIDEVVVEDTAADKVMKSPDAFDMSIDELIAERNTHWKEMDRVYLEEFKASQQKQLQFMRDRLARQEQRIEEMEKRNQEIYDIRAANVKEMQEMRESFGADRI